MKGKIAWLVPFPIKGSGGHRTFFLHINYLIKCGYECHVYVETDWQREGREDVLQELVESYFGKCSAYFHSGYEVHGSFDIAIATAWWTAEIVAKQVNTKHKIYFVQDFEPWFNPMGDIYIQAENSYTFGLIPLTIGPWLAHYLHERYDTPANYFDFTADSSLYYPMDSVDKEKAVCFVYQPEKPRRCASMGRDALAIVKHHCPEVKIYTYGSEQTPDFPFDHQHLGILSVEECNRLYNRCRVGLCLSSSNPSRVPYEMMASGLPAVDFYGENTIYDFPEKGILLTKRNPSSLAGAILKILESPALQNEMRTHGLQFMQNRPAKLEFEQFADCIDFVLAGQTGGRKIIVPLYNVPPFSADLAAPPQPTHRKEQETKKKDNLFLRLRNNRIGRTLKVLVKGYY